MITCLHSFSSFQNFIGKYVSFYHLNFGMLSACVTCSGIAHKARKLTLRENTSFITSCVPRMSLLQFLIHLINFCNILKVVKLYSLKGSSFSQLFACYHIAPINHELFSRSFNFLYTILAEVD